MNNKLTDLNNFLFAQLERLDSEDLTDEQIKTEIQRSKAIKDIGSAIVENAKLALDVQKYLHEYGRPENVELPEMLESKS